MSANGERVTLKVWTRDSVNSRASRQLRKNGFVPATISIRGQDSISVKIKRDELIKNIKEHGRNYLFNAVLDDGKETHTVIVKDMQYSPVKRELLDVSFQRVSMDEEIKVELDIRISGREEAESRRLLVMPQIDKIPVKGLPQNIPDYLDIDVASLNADDKITVGDIQYPEGITPDCETDRLVLVVSEAKTSAVEEAAEEEQEEQGSQEASE